MKGSFGVVARIPSYRARLMAKRTSDVSLSFWQGVLASLRSWSSSRSRSRYQDGVDCGGRRSFPYQSLNSASQATRMFRFELSAELSPRVDSL